MISRLTASWLFMLAFAAAQALMLMGLAGLPRRAMVAVVMAAGLAKGRLILLDYLDLRTAGDWRSGALVGLFLLVAGLAVLAAV
jgi:hypothetical protein